jgi:pilus assembly protein Flp/PilA
MKRLGVLFARLRKEEKGATMIEYSILIGIITILAIAFISEMGTWVALQWSTLVAYTGAG